MLGPWAIAIVAVTAMALITYGLARPDSGHAMDEPGTPPAPQLTYEVSDDFSLVGFYDELNDQATRVELAGLELDANAPLTREELDGSMAELAGVIKTNLGWSLPEDLGKLRAEAQEAHNSLKFLKDPQNEHQRLLVEMASAFNGDGQCRDRCLLPGLPKGSAAKFTRTVLLGSGVLVANQFNAYFELEPNTAAAILLGTAIACNLAIWAWQTHEEIRQGQDRNQEIDARVREQVYGILAQVANGGAQIAVEVAEQGGGPQQAALQAHDEMTEIIVQGAPDNGAPLPPADPEEPPSENQPPADPPSAETEEFVDARDYINDEFR